MIFHVNDIDSIVFEKIIGDIKDFDSNIDFKGFEQEYIDKHNPFYVIAKIDSKDIRSVHILEDNGFKFIEFQMHIRMRVKELDLPIAGYQCKEVDNESDLKKVVDIARTTFTDDRVFVDKELMAMFEENIAAKRYEYYVRQSYHLEDQKLYKVFDSATDEVVAFFTFKLLEKSRVLSLLEGVAKDLKGSIVGASYRQLYFEELKKMSVKHFYGACSGRNLDIINLSFTLNRGTIVNTLIVLRKIYK